MSLGASAVTKPIDAFVKETGQSFRQYETGVTNAAAIVVVSDWTLDYPRPVPPKVHVGRFSYLRNDLFQLLSMLLM